MSKRILARFTAEDFGTLAICAIRYCQGRQTYMPALVRKIIAKHIDRIPDKDLLIMIEDCKSQARSGHYGDNVIDKPGWIDWEMFLIAEKKRRRL